MNQKLIEKIEKLMALATSSNEHEAALAAAKVNELDALRRVSHQPREIKRLVREVLT